MHTLANHSQNAGTEEADDLIDGGYLEATKDKFGRDAWKYSRTRRYRKVRKVTEASHKTSMDLNAAQSSAVHSDLAATTLGLASRKTTHKPQPLSPEDQEKNAKLTAVKKLNLRVAAAIKESTKWQDTLADSKHALAKKISSSLQSSHKSLVIAEKNVAQLLNNLEANHKKINQKTIEATEAKLTSTIGESKANVKLAKAL